MRMNINVNTTAGHAGRVLLLVRPAVVGIPGVAVELTCVGCSVCKAPGVVTNPVQR